MSVIGKCPKCGYDQTIDYNCIVCMGDEIKQLQEENNRLECENAGLKALVESLQGEEYD